MTISSIGFFLAFMMVGAFFFGFRNGVVALILLRPLCDRVFELGRFDVGTQSISCGAFVNIAVIVALLCNLSRVWQSVPPKFRTIWLPYLLLAFVAVTYSPIQMEALRRFLTYFCFFTMFAFAFVVVRSERDLLYFLKMIILSSVAPVAYGLFQLTTRLDLFEDGRIRSTFSHPNIFAFFIVIVIGVILFLQATARIKVSSRYRLILLVYLVPLLTLLLFTKTRSAWISCAVELLAYGIVYDRKVLVLLLLAPFIVLAIPGVGDRVNDLSSGNDYLGGPAINVNAYTWRRILWESTFTYIWQRPIFGYGLDSFGTYSPEFFPLDHLKGTAAHSYYIETIFEMGFVGLIGFSLIFVRCFIWLGRFWRFDKRGVPVVAAAMIAYLIDCYSDNISAYLTFDWCFWFFFGVIFSQFYQYRARASDHPKPLYRRSRTRVKKMFGNPVPLPHFPADIAERAPLDRQF
jgi:putative inorganic carbon (hco3(-)) transporter